MFIPTELPWFFLVLLLPSTCAIRNQNKTDAFDLNYKNYGHHFEDHSFFTNTTDTREVGYEKILKWMQFAMTLTGFAGNSVAYITLSRNGETFTNPTMLRLIKNQSVLDTIVCFIGGISVLQPPMWRVGNHNFSYFICQVRFFNRSTELGKYHELYCHPCMRINDNFIQVSVCVCLSVSVSVSVSVCACSGNNN